jgi:hypothetical protein
MGRHKKTPPAPGGAVTEVSEVRGPIKDMLAPGDEKSFLQSLPEQTTTEDLGVSPEEVKPRKKRRTKAEMEAEKGPQVVDKRLERAKGKCAGLGASSLIATGFELSGKPLNPEEDEDLADQFYLISVKAGANTDNWLFIILYTVALILRLVASRTELGEQLRKLFEPKPKEEEQKEALKPA